MVYWPPSSRFWDAPLDIAKDAKKQRQRKNLRCNGWDGLLGVFLRLYNPDLAELEVVWTFREHANDRGYLATWYRTVHEVLSREKHRPVRQRYDHLAGCGGLWPNPPPARARSGTPRPTVAVG